MPGEGKGDHGRPLTDDLLGLPLGEALTRLERRGIAPEVLQTAAPRAREGGVWRVVRVRLDGRELTAAQFLDPLTGGGAS